MNKRIPPNAFGLFVELGPGRSYQALADKIGVSKKAVAMCAAREGWRKRLEEIERRAHALADEKLAESIGEMTVRQLKVLRFMQGRAIETMKSLPLTSAKEAMTVYLQAMEQERIVRGVKDEPEEDKVIIIQ